MRDVDVRTALHAKVLADHHGHDDTLVIDELGLWYGTARIDIAVVNGRIHGFEIKSARDTLERLPAQVLTYGRVMDRVTIVAAKKHLPGVQQLVPAWWGIKVATQGRRSAVHFEDERAPKNNPSVDPVAVAALLWCDELEQQLDSRDALRGYRGKSRDKLTRRMAEVFSLTDLRAAVRARLKARDTWRAAERPAQCDG